MILIKKNIFFILLISSIVLSIISLFSLLSLFNSIHSIEPARTPHLSNSTQELIGCIEQNKWLSVEDFCGSSSYIEYDFFLGDSIEVWLMTKENYLKLEQGTPLNSQISRLIFSGIGAHGRITIPKRGIWVLVFFNRVNSITCFNQDESIVNFVTISDSVDVIDDNIPPNNNEGSGVPNPYILQDLRFIIVLTLLIIIVSVIISCFFLFLKNRTSHSKVSLDREKINHEIKRILNEKGGILINSKKFCGIEWIEPASYPHNFKNQGLLKIPQSYSKDVFEKSYYFHRDTQFVIRLKVYKHLYYLIN